MVHAKLNGQTIDKRKSVDSSAPIGEPVVGPSQAIAIAASNYNQNQGGNSGVVTIKKQNGRLPSRKLEPIAQESTSSVVANANAKVKENSGKVSTKVSPFLGQSQSVMDNASVTISNMSLGGLVSNLPIAGNGAQHHPAINARNLNV